MTKELKHLREGLDLLSIAISQRLYYFFSKQEQAPAKILPADIVVPRMKSIPVLNAEEFVILTMALAPHIVPGFFDAAIQQYLPQGGEFPELGGIKTGNQRGMQPTGETALFILAGMDVSERLRVSRYFSADHIFYKKNILWLDTTQAGEPALSAKLVLSQEYVDLLLIGKASKPRFSSSFPARHIETGLGWEDLVLSAEAMQQVRELQTWILHKKSLMNGLKMSKKLKRGYRVLFYGPPGTGKTLTATLLGKHTRREVYRIDLSMVVSKYIGETEKNLEALFNRAEAKDWILFFDEADALFGKRTGVRDAHDKYANQEVSYLLQRVEDFDGLVILASNMKSNIDEAFIRRFNAIIRFTQPTPDEREKIWRNSFPEKMEFGNNEDVPSLVKQYDLSGGSIVNIVQYACLKTLEKGNKEIFLEDVVEGIKREMHKEGKPF
jgi:hypothetical protein